MLCFISANTQMAQAQSTQVSTSQEESEIKLDALNSGIKRITQWLSRADNERSKLNKELKQAELNINHLSKQIRQTKDQIRQNADELSKLAQTLSTHRQELSKQRLYLEKQLQIEYFQEEHSQLKLLLNTDNPQDLGRLMHYFSTLKNARKEKIGELNTLLKKIQDTERTVEKKTATLKQQETDLQASQTELSQTLKKKQTLLSKLEKTIQSNSAHLQQMQEDQAQLQTIVHELEKSIAELKLPNDSAPFSQQKSKLPWPSHVKVLAGFGSTLASGKLKLNGIRFSSKENDPVTAIYSGRVIFSNWIRGYGLLIIIDHGEQFMSLYGNNKSLLRATGDWIRAGETIAVSSESTTNSDSALYFEIRQNGKPVNPQLWLRK